MPWLSNIARIGTVEPLPPSGWRAWLATWLGRGDLASASPAAVAAVGCAAAPRVAADDRALAPLATAPVTTARPAAAPLGAASVARSFVWFADPVHLIAGMTSLHLAPRGILALDPLGQEMLCRAFNEAFATAGYHLLPARGGRFLAKGPAPRGAVRTTEPARVLGASVADALPQGAGASALLALGGEFEMWLYEHPLNAQRARERRPPVSTLWLWGGGAPLDEPGAEARPAEARHAAVFGDDAYMEGIARLCGARFAGPARDIAQVAADEAPRRVVALELFRPDAAAASEAFEEPLGAIEAFEREWIAPALEQLKRRRLSRLTIIANDRRLSIAYGDRFKVWRRFRPALEALQ